MKGFKHDYIDPPCSSGLPSPPRSGPAPPPRRSANSAAPPDLTAPPADATKSATGLISKVVTPGRSAEKPGRHRHRHGELHGLGERRQDVRQLGDAWQPVHLPAEPRDGRVEGMRAADGRSARSGAAGCRRSSPTRGRPARPLGTVVFDIELLEIARRRRRFRRPTSPRCRPTPSAPRRGSPTRCCGRARASDAPDGLREVLGALHGLDHRRQDVRQLGPARRARRRFGSTR